jgi:L-fuconate dehydratase
VPRIVAVDVVDVRFPTSDSLDGSDAMHPDPDYSAAYVVLRTDARDADELSGQGHGLTFTIGRGTEVVCAAVDALVPMVVGIDVDELMGDLGRFARMLGGDSQLRWIGPEKGAIHLATAALVNAAWDLRAKRESKPLWRVLADLSPEELVELVDFTYLTDMVTPAAAVELLRAQEPHRADRIAELERDGYPAYTTSAGWLGYDDDKIRALCREAIADGFNAIKMKVGADLDDDMRRAALLRGELGPDRLLMTDANQRWDVGQAIEWMRALAEQDPYWIEEPTSPDDVLGHAAIARALAPMKVATGEHAHNRVMFKQLLQAQAIGVCQVDSCRLGGVNEVLAVLLMAAVAGVPVCPHAGGVGLCEYVSHLAPFDYIAVSGSLDGRMCEWADHLHEHFADPVSVRGGRYVLPSAPGYGITMRPESLDRFRFPDGPVWAERVSRA